jgi:hypothetical protein
MLQDNVHIGHLFSDKIQSNKWIAQTTQELEQELLKLIEIVLLDNYGPITSDA